MPVYLRKKQGKARSRYYLDIYHNGQRRYEFLDLYLVPGRNPINSELNRQHKELAEKIRAKKQLELESGNYDIEPKHKQHVSFLEYFDAWLQRYPNKDIRLAKACHRYFIRFIDANGINKNLTTRQVNKDLAKRFRAFLDEHLNGETPHNYFSKFIKLCNEATEDKLINVNPCRGIKNKRPEGLKKDILSLDEIKALKAAEMPQKEVKRAFLFCLNTGLRWVDVKALKWNNIDGEVLKLIQTKTGKEAVIYLNDYALSLIPERGKRDELVFSLPSSTSALSHLKRWVENAGIDKHITWHSARHSFAVNLLSHHVDVKTLSSLLGHSGLKHTEIYTRVVDELKRQAVKTINS
jgi:integrase/recombinase XerD